MQPDDLLTLSKQELVEKLQEYNLVYDDAMAVLVMIRSELIARLKEENKDGELIDEHEISIRKRVNIKTPIDVARELGCVKTEEKVDATKIRKLYASGVKIEGVDETEYLSVRRIKQEENE